MDISEIKNEIREFLISKLTPQAVVASYETPLSDGVNNFNLAQSFKPFSTCFRPRKGVTSTNIPVSLSLVKYGTPDSGVKVSLQASNASALPSGIDIASFKISPGEVYGSATIVTKNLALTEYLTSKQEYNILITPEFSISSASYISVNRNNVDDKYAFGTVVKAIAGTTSWVAQSWDIYFKFIPSNWVYTDYPRADLSIKSYPRLVVDITSRRTEARWISHEVAQYIMTFQLTMYSEYLDELDLVLSKADQALFESRIKWDTFDEYFPGNMTRPSVARQNLISRALVSTIKKKQGTGEFDPEGFDSGFNINGVAAE